jgi:hypothetical protein|nr:MAG TPA: minor capsid protein [Caudoviricetes sp.]
MDYDVARSLARIEDDITASLIRNLKHHRAQETEEGLEWVQWQTVQLQELDKFKRRYAKKLNKEFKRINPHIDEAINEAFNQGKMDEEVAILESIKEGKGKGKAYRRGSSFFQKDNKIEKIINATTNDMEKAEYAILRRANDQYRTIIFDAQMYAASGAGTYEKAIDMATHDFLSAGINCVQYKNGARVSVSKYAEMAIRTATKRAYLQGQGEMRQEWGISTVILNKRTSACPLCAPFVGKVFIDDVWSGGTSKDGNYPLLSSAISAGLYHPNCKDSHTTYFPGTSTKPEHITRRDLVKMVSEAKRESKATYCERQAERCGRLARYSLDTDKQRIFRSREQQWIEKKFEYTERELAHIKDDGIIDAGHVNLKLVNSYGFHKKFEGIVDSKAVCESMYTESMKILKSRNNTLYEEIVALDARTGEVLIKNTTAVGKKTHACGFSALEQEYLESRGTPYIVIHNHPNSSFPSRDDIKKLFDREGQSGSLITCHNGDVYYISKQKNDKNIETLVETIYTKKKRELIGHPKAMIEEETSKTIIKFLIKSKRVSFIKR